MLTHTIAAVILEIAYLVTGVILCFLGKSLLEKGITGGFTGEGEIASQKFKLITSSPGVVYAVAGLVIVTIAVKTPAEYVEGGTGGAGPNRTSLEELTTKVISSRLAQPSPGRIFAEQQLEAAVAAAAAGNAAEALVAASTAVVAEPAHLRRVLDHSELGELAHDARFGAIVRARFALPLEVPQAPAPLDAALLGELRLYLNLRPELLRAAKPASRSEAFPPAMETEPRIVTRDRLLQLLDSDPAALLDGLESPRHQWVLQDTGIVAALRARLRERMQ